MEFRPLHVIMNRNSTNDSCLLFDTTEMSPVRKWADGSNCSSRRRREGCRHCHIRHDHQHVGLQAQCDGGSTILPARTGPRQVNRADVFMFMCYPAYVC